MCATTEYIMVRWLYSFLCSLHYPMSLCRCAWKFQNTCQVHFVECLSKIKGMLSIIFHAIYRAVCVQFTYISCDYFKNTCILFYYHPHSVSTWRDSCVRVYAPLTLASPLTKKQNRTRGTQLHLNQAGGIWIDAWVCLHYWVVIWVAGWSNFHLHCAVYGVCHRQNSYGLKVVFCLRHFTAFHYHHCARLLTGIEYI